MTATIYWNGLEIEIDMEDGQVMEVFIHDPLRFKDWLEIEHGQTLSEQADEENPELARKIWSQARDVLPAGGRP